jgi:hypothetical protein
MYVQTYRLYSLIYLDVSRKGVGGRTTFFASLRPLFLAVKRTECKLVFEHSTERKRKLEKDPWSASLILGIV